MLLGDLLITTHGPGTLVSKNRCFRDFTDKTLQNKLPIKHTSPLGLFLCSSACICFGILLNQDF